MDNRDLIKTAHERYAEAVEAESDNREARLDDYRFEGGDQWSAAIKRMRENDPDGPRPCIVVNKARKHKNALLNDLRRNRPQIKVLPVDDAADIETAKVLNGLLRHIQSVSDADIAYDTAAEHQITAGLGYFRVGTKVIDEKLNQQEIDILPINNPFSVHMDPFSEHPAGADAMWCFVSEEVPLEKFKRMHPDADAVDFESADRDTLWFPDKETVRVAEYFHIEEVDGEKRCMWHKLAGDQVLDERELPCSYVPIIKVVGEERRHDRIRDYRGIIRDIKDPARLYNYNKSAYVERVSLSPKAPYIGPEEAFAGHEQDWQNANTSNQAYLSYNQFEPETGERLDRPQRAQPTPVETALIQAMIQDDEDIRSVSGQNQAGFGEPGNETSGRAINARRMEQDTNTFHFVDNLTRSIRHAGRIIVEMIPRIYDTRRVVRILGEDETPDFAVFDPSIPRAMQEQPDVTGGIQSIYNPGIGRYDVRVTVGPSYATQAEEGAERLSQLIQAAPDLMSIAGDLLFKNMQIPGAEELAERMSALLPPELKALQEAKKSGQEQGMQQAEMVRQQMMEQIAPMVEELKAALDAAAQENDELQGAVDEMKAKLDNRQAEYELKAAEIEIKAREQAAKEREAALKHEADMAGHEAEVATAYIEAQAGGKGDESSSVANTSAAVASQQAVKMMSELAEQLSEQIQAIAQAAQGAVQAVQGVQASHNEQKQQIEELSARVASDEARREAMAEVAAGLLSGKLSDAQAASALSGSRLN